MPWHSSPLTGELFFLSSRPYPVYYSALSLNVTSLISLITQVMFTLKRGVWFPSPWIWAGRGHLLHQQNRWKGLCEISESRCNVYPGLLNSHTWSPKLPYKKSDYPDTAMLDRPCVALQSTTPVFQPPHRAPKSRQDQPSAEYHPDNTMWNRRLTWLSPLQISHPQNCEKIKQLLFY